MPSSAVSRDGATMAFRIAYRDLILPIPPAWVHDAWIALLISAVAHCALVPQPLIQYRQHSGQQLGKQRRGILRTVPCCESNGSTHNQFNRAPSLVSPPGNGSSALAT